MELAESEATRDKLEAEIKGLNEEMDTLRAQLKALEDSLKSQEALMMAVKDSSDTVASSIKKVLEANKAAILEQIAHLDKRFARNR